MKWKGQAIAVAEASGEAETYPFLFIGMRRASNQSLLNLGV